MSLSTDDIFVYKKTLIIHRKIVRVSQNIWQGCCIQNYIFVNYQQKLELKLKKKKNLEQLLEVTSLSTFSYPPKTHPHSKKKILVILKMNTHCYKDPLDRLICRCNTTLVPVTLFFLGSCEVGPEVCRSTGFSRVKTRD